MPTVNTVIRDSLYLTDTAGTAITGAIPADFTATASLLGSATTAAVTITERASGGGMYDTAFTPTAIGFWELFITYDVGATQRQFHGTYEVIAANDAASVAAAVVSALPARQVVTVVSPVATTGAVTVQQGDDYLAADGRALTWTSTGWPDLTGATVEWQVGLRGEETVYPATVVDAETVRVELTAVQTAALAPRLYRSYQLVATLAGGSTATLTRGDLFVEPA